MPHFLCPALKTKPGQAHPAKRFLTGLVVFLILSASVLCRAQDPEPVTLDPIVVTAKKIQDFRKNNPELVVEMNREEIRKGNFGGLDQVLNALPGVDVKKSGTGSRISIMGSGGNGKILVLINGRPANSTQYGSVDLDSIPLDLIQQVMVFKPPVPVFLGPGGTSGAVNIVLANEAQGKSKKNSRISLQGGSYGKGELTASHLADALGEPLQLTASVKHRDGRRTNSDRDSASLGFQWDLPLGTTTRYDLSGRYYESEYGSSGPVHAPTPDARQEYQKGSLDFHAKGSCGETGESDLKVYADGVSLKDKSQAGFTSTLDELVLGVKNEITWKTGPDGVSFQLITGASENQIEHTLSGNHTRETALAGFQSEISGKKFKASLGARCDYSSDFDFQPAGHAGVNFFIRPDTRLRVNGGYSVNIPTFGQLYQPSHGSIDQVRGNPDLTEETVLTLSAGIIHEFSNNRTAEIIFFREDLEDMIGYEEGLDSIKRPSNIREALRQGMEALLSWKLTDTARLDLSYTLQSTENKDTHRDLTYAPGQKFKAGVKWTSPLETRVEASFSAFGSQFSDLANSAEKKVSGYQTVDLKLIHPVKLKSIHTEIFLLFENLLDEAYETHYGYPVDGLCATLGLTMEF
jgi:iron complex outermembrane receptor protein